MSDYDSRQINTTSFTLPKKNTNQYQNSGFVHVMLTKNPETSDNRLSWGMIPICDKQDGSEAEAEIYASILGQASFTKSLIARSKDSTPFDIEIRRPAGKRQCCVIVQLDPTINWRFCPDTYGVTKKSDYGGTGNYKDSDFGLKFFRASGPVEDSIPETAPLDDDCRVAIWRMRYRQYAMPPEDPPGMHGFNLHVEFFQPKVGGYHRMPTVFDPDIGNPGSGIP